MFRNKEFRRCGYGFLLISLGLGGVGFSMGISQGILVVLSAMAFGALFYVFTKLRYRRIALLSEKIDLVLYNDDYLFISEEEEGELSILQSEITKMTLRIRELNTLLKKEKENLADSLADIAHQLRTPLTSVNLLMSLLEESGEEKEKKELLWEAKELLARMDWLLTALLKLSRLDAGVVTFCREPIEVAKLVRTASLPLLISMELHDITLQVKIPEGVKIYGDLEWIGQAIQNILKNCMESVGDHGRIEIACTDTLLYTEIVVRDYGTGFAKEDLQNLFERFYRGKSSVAAGYGIGLALCKRIIVRQGGTVSAKNHPQGGAVFTIRFPK